MSNRNGRQPQPTGQSSGHSGQGYPNDFTSELPSNIIGLNGQYSSFQPNELGRWRAPGRQAASSRTSTLVQDDSDSFSVQTMASGQQQQWVNDTSHGLGSQRYGGQYNMPPQVGDYSAGRPQMARDAATQQQFENVNTRLRGSGLGNQDQDNRERYQFQQSTYGTGYQFQTSPHNSFGNASSVDSSVPASQYPLCTHGDIRRACFNPYCPHYVHSRN